MTPGEGIVRLVPDLIQRDLTGKVADSGIYITEPSRHLTLRHNGRTANSTEHRHSQLCVQRIAVAQIQPGLQTPGEQVIHNVIQPGKIVHTPFFFGSCPAGLETDHLHTGGGYLVVSLVGIKHRTIQLFKADTHTRAGQLAGGQKFHLRIKNQSFHKNTSIIGK